MIEVSRMATSGCSKAEIAIGKASDGITTAWPLLEIEHDDARLVVSMASNVGGAHFDEHFTSIPKRLVRVEGAQVASSHKVCEPLVTFIV